MSKAKVFEHGITLRTVKGREAAREWRNTVWVLTYRARNNREVFLASYPTAALARQDAQEGFVAGRTYLKSRQRPAQQRRYSVSGFDASMLR